MLEAVLSTETVERFAFVERVKTAAFSNLVLSTEFGASLDVIKSVKTLTALKLVLALKSLG